MALIFVVVIILQGIWLAGLSYLMWRRYLREKAKAQQKPEEKAPSS